ncbi:MAG: RidA family protein [Pseudomonadota bacterium]
MPREAIVPSKFKDLYDNFHFAPAVRAGDMLYLSGVVASLEGEETQADQAPYERAFADIDTTLKEAGASWDDVVEMTTYHTDMMPQLGAFMPVKDKWLTAPYPAWTAIEIDRLVPDRGIVEIKVTAYAPR